MNLNPADDFIAPPCLQKIEILYQDDDILVINKPSGLLSLSGKNPANLDSVHYRLRKDFAQCTMIHRLDLGTSGIMLLALHKEANRHLSQQFSLRKIEKRYIALLDGLLEGKDQQDSGLIDLPIIKDVFPRHRVFQHAELGQVIVAGKTVQAKAAQSFFKVVQRDLIKNTSLVEFQPITGRTHQLRIHSQAIGHSILGCDLYGDTRTHSLAPRLMLHASQLTFCHPVSQEQMTINCPAPF